MCERSCHENKKQLQKEAVLTQKNHCKVIGVCLQILRASHLS